MPPPAPPGASGPAPPAPPPPPAKAGTEDNKGPKPFHTFSRFSPRDKKKGGKKRGRQTFLKRYGLLRNVVARVPGFLAVVELFLVHFLHILSHLILAVLIPTELLGMGLLSRKPDPGTLARPLGTARRLASLGFDSSLGVLQALATLLRQTPLPAPGENFMSVLRRLAILQNVFGALLHFSSVIRWQARSSDYRVPPLLLLFAYFVVPWLSVSCFVIMLRPDDHLLGGGIAVDCGVLAVMVVVRIALFGRYGRPRMPREAQPMLVRAADASVLAFAVVLLDVLLLRNTWLERRMNWKYIFCAAILAGPIPYWWNILVFFREDKAAKAKRSTEDAAQTSSTKDSAARKGGLTLKALRSQLYAKPRPGVLNGASIQRESVEETARLRSRRAAAHAAGNAVAPPSGPAPGAGGGSQLPVVGLKADGDSSGSAGAGSLPSETAGGDKVSNDKSGEEMLLTATQ